jgi:hypothetical protein
LLAEDHRLFVLPVSPLKKMFRPGLVFHEVLIERLPFSLPVITGIKGSFTSMLSTMFADPLQDH